MAGIVYELIDVLKEQKECYEGLITLGEYKQNAVINKNIEFLEEIVQTEEQFIGRVAILDKKRDSLMKDIAIVTGMKYDHITITSIINKLGDQNEAAGLLMDLRDSTKVLLKKLKSQSELNKTLLNQSLELVDFMVNALGSSNGYVHTGSYEKSGDDSSIREQSLFDKKQ